MDNKGLKKFTAEKNYIFFEYNSHFISFYKELYYFCT